MKKPSSVRGVWTALITPMLANGELDTAAFRRLIQDQIGAGVDGVIPCGTTGESPTLSLEEKQGLIRIALEETRKTKTRVIAGTGSNCTAESVELSKWADQQGVAGVLIVCPYYNKPTQGGLEAHFTAIADAVKCEVVLYNVPGRTACTLTTETIVKLAQHPRIGSLKEATGDISFTKEITTALKGRTLNILSGDDATYYPLLLAGAVGVISVSSNVVPRTMLQLQHAFDKKDAASAKNVHERLAPLFKDLFLESNPIPIKYAMARAGLCQNVLRLPLTPFSSTPSQVLEQTLSKIGLEKNKGTL